MFYTVLLEPVPMRQKTPTLEDNFGIIDMESQNLNLKFESMSQNAETEEILYKSKNFLELDSEDDDDNNDANNDANDDTNDVDYLSIT